MTLPLPQKHDRASEPCLSERCKSEFAAQHASQQVYTETCQLIYIRDSTQHCLRNVGCIMVAVHGPEDPHLHNIVAQRASGTLTASIGTASL